MSKNNTYRGHEYVDLGLSVYWATCNVGAAIPEDCGDYYTWEVVKEMYYENSGKIDGSYDLACVRWGSGWRLPTNVEINELIENCDYEWTKLNGACGGKFTRHGSIFLTAAGWPTMMRTAMSEIMAATGAPCPSTAISWGAASRLQQGRLLNAMERPVYRLHHPSRSGQEMCR